jgi:hypothetical protein
VFQFCGKTALRWGWCGSVGVWACVPWKGL